MDDKVLVYSGIVLLLIITMCMYLISRISGDLYNARVDMNLQKIKQCNIRINNLLGGCVILMIVYIGLLLTL